MRDFLLKHLEYPKHKSIHSLCSPLKANTSTIVKKLSVIAAAAGDKVQIISCIVAASINVFLLCCTTQSGRDWTDDCD